MTKAQEIEFIKNMAKELGPDSYLGPALEELIPHISFDIRSDFQPDLVGYIKKMEDQAGAKTSEIKEQEAKLKELTEAYAEKERALRYITSALDAAKDSARDHIHHLNGLLK